MNDGRSQPAVQGLVNQYISGGLSRRQFVKGALALGLGDIQVESALHQPLAAQIEIVGASPDSSAGLSATIPDSETFQRYGLERPASLASTGLTVRGRSPHVCSCPAGRASVLGQEFLPPSRLGLNVGIEAIEGLWADLDRALRVAVEV